MPENLRLDRVSIGAKDIDATAAWLQSVAGLYADESWGFMGGLRNRIAYSGGAAVEILGVGIPGMEMINPLTQQISGRTIAGDLCLTWAVATDDIEATARRLGLEVLDGGAYATTGERITWKMCGVVEAFFSEPYLPYFLSYSDAGWQERALRAAPAFDVAEIEMSGDADRLTEWLGGADMSVRIEDGPSQIHSFTLDVEGDRVELRPSIVSA